MKSRKYQVCLEQDVTWAPSATQTQRLQGGVHQDQPRLLHENPQLPSRAAVWDKLLCPGCSHTLPRSLIPRPSLGLDPRAPPGMG